MTRRTRRLQWRQAVAGSSFPASQRPVKATLLSLVELMTPDGDLQVWRDELESATGLPPRTLSRHLARAVEDGWLSHEVQGGRNHRAVYRAAIPDGSVGHSRRTETRLSRPSTRQQNPGSVGHPVAESIKTEHSRQRVPGTRRSARQTTPHDSDRASPPEDSAKDGSNGDEWQPTPSKRPSSVSTTRVVA